MAVVDAFGSGLDAGGLTTAWDAVTGKSRYKPKTQYLDVNSENAVLAGEARKLEQSRQGYTQDLLPMLQQAAQGQGPSAAQAQLQEGADRTLEQQYALAAGAGGSPAARAAAFNQAQQNAGALGAQTAQQAAQLRAQEQQAAMQQYGQATEGLATLDLQRAQAQQQAGYERARAMTEISQGNAERKQKTTSGILGALGGVLTSDEKTKEKKAAAGDEAVRAALQSFSPGALYKQNADGTFSEVKQPAAAPAAAVEPGVLYKQGAGGSFAEVRPSAPSGYDDVLRSRSAELDPATLDAMLAELAAFRAQAQKTNVDPRTAAAMQAELGAWEDSVRKFRDAQAAPAVSPSPKPRPAVQPAGYALSDVRGKEAIDDASTRDLRAALQLAAQPKSEIEVMRRQFTPPEDEAGDPFVEAALRRLATPEGSREALADVDPYTYQYKPEYAGIIGQDTSPRVGVMAQDLERSPAFEPSVVETPIGKAIDGPTALSTALATLAGLDKRLREIEDRNVRGIRDTKVEYPQLGDAR